MTDELRTHLINQEIEEKEIKNLFDFIKDNHYDTDTLKYEYI